MNSQQIAYYLPIVLYYLVVFALGYGIAHFYCERKWGYKLLGTIFILVALIKYPAFINDVDKPTFITGFLFFHRYRILYFVQSCISFLLSIIKAIFRAIFNILNFFFRINKKAYADNHYNDMEDETQKERRYREYEESMRKEKKKASQGEREKYEEQDPYKVFDLPHTATKEEIAERYIMLVKLYHPDKFEQAGEFYKEESKKRMQMINSAYAELKKKF